MSCKNFEAIITDLAREQMLEATARESTLRHLEECAACARRLEDERKLSLGFRALAASNELAQAPVGVEANLLAKFRERTAREKSTVVVPMPARNSRWQQWRPRMAVAAAILMFAVGGAIALRMRQTETPASQPSTLAGRTQANVPAMPASSGTTEAQAVDEETTTPLEIAAVPGKSSGGQRLSKGEADLLLGRSSRRSNTVNVPKSLVNRSEMASTSAEIATDFMPISYGDNLNSIDSGRIVRVEMPRSALAQFGLPVNMDRANERIKADVLIGDDGLARAIRFVR